MKDKTKSYIIGETACIHEGEFSYLLRMIDEIAEIEINAVKLHLLLNLGSYISKTHPVAKVAVRRIFSKEKWSKIFDYSNNKGLDIVALCNDIDSIKYIISEKKDVFAIEIHATSLNDYYLLKTASEFDGFILLGVSGSTIDEIRYAVDFLNAGNAKKIVLMYGFQSFPTNYRDINFSKMLKLRELFSLPIGYADHTAFDSPYNKIISILPAAMGFNILEKHYTLRQGERRTDYESAVGREAMLEIKELMKIALGAYGGKELAYMSKAELEYGKIGPMKKAIVARKFIKKGQKLSTDNLWFKRTREPGLIKQNQFLDLVGLEAAKDLEADEIIDFTKVKDCQVKAK